MQDQSDLPCAEKLAFNTQKDAKAAALTAQYKHGDRLKIYQCKHCQLWHLTSSYS